MTAIKKEKEERNAKVPLMTPASSNTMKDPTLLWAGGTKHLDGKGGGSRNESPLVGKRIADPAKSSAYTPDFLKKQTWQDLRHICRMLEIPGLGTKADFIARIVDSQNQNNEPDEGPKEAPVPSRNRKSTKVKKTTSIV
eukprot:scaffold691506_cov47-Attheya_sp.AAC.1